MPVTRRRRATSPEQPENTNTAAQTSEQAAGSPAEASAAELSTTEKTIVTERSSTVDSATGPATTEEPEAPTAQRDVDGEAFPVASQETSSASSEDIAQMNSETVSPLKDDARSLEAEQASLNRQDVDGDSQSHDLPHPRRASSRAAAEHVPYQPVMPSGPTNGDRQDFPSSIESGRRTARGELFRRPPQPPTPQLTPPVPQPAQLQAPTHEINLPLGNLLHLAYNPGYTGSDEARSSLLHQLEDESKAGGRARCWNCGSLAIVYDRWNTRSKTFGEIGVAFCEICGVWSVM